MTLDSFTTFVPHQGNQLPPAPERKSEGYKADRNDDYKRTNRDDRDNRADRADRSDDTRRADRADRNDGADKSDNTEKTESFEELVTKASGQTVTTDNDISTLFVDGQSLSQEQTALINKALQGITLTPETANIKTTAPNLTESVEDTIGQLLLLEGTNPDKVTGTLFNLTPSQLEQVQSDIQLALQNGESLEQAENSAFNFIVVNLTKPAAGPVAHNGKDAELVKTMPFANAKGQNAAQALNGDAQTSNMNGLLQGDQMAGGEFDDLLNIQSSSDKFKALMKNAATLRQQAEGDYTSRDNIPVASDSKNAQAANAQTGLTASATSLNGQGMPAGDFMASLGWDVDTLTSMGIASAGTPAPQTAQSAELVNLTTQARHAAQSHPSTTMVSATLNKATTANGNKTINLQLDPPELGRIEIRMEFGKDRTLKAQIISEKPEAHLLLQRDAQTLERALQNSGLDTDSQSLEFTLAEGENSFNQDGSHDGSRNEARHGGDGEGAEDEGETVLIETNMNWVIDPETGHTHYSILV